MTRVPRRLSAVQSSKCLKMLQAPVSRHRTPKFPQPHAPYSGFDHAAPAWTSDNLLKRNSAFTASSPHQTIYRRRNMLAACTRCSRLHKGSSARPMECRLPDKTSRPHLTNKSRQPSRWPRCWTLDLSCVHLLSRCARLEITAVRGGVGGSLEERP